MYVCWRRERRREKSSRKQQKAIESLTAHSVPSLRIENEFNLVEKWRNLIWLLLLLLCVAIIQHFWRTLNFGICRRAFICGTRSDYFCMSDFIGVVELLLSKWLRFRLIKFVLLSDKFPFFIFIQTETRESVHSAACNKKLSFPFLLSILN